MTPPDLRSKFRSDQWCDAFAILICLTLLALGQHLSFAQQPQQAQSQVMTTGTPAPAEPKIPADQLDSLVAPIALFSDPLLAQTLAASTYPLEVIQMQQWVDRNKELKDKALADAVAKQPWDPSVQSLAAVPEVLTRLSSNIQWTTDLGNAYLDQPKDVMDAVQRMRVKAQGTGNLKTSSQQVVQTRTVSSGQQVVYIEPASTETVYVPSYDPQVVYGPPAYPYYPYSYPGYYAGMGLAFGTGLLMGSYWGGNWGDCDWNGGDININNNNNFNRNNINRGNRNQVNPLGGRGQGNRWQHNPSHRGNAPYGNRRTNDKFGGGNRGNRGPGAGNRPGAGGGGIAGGNRPSTLPSGGNRPGAGNRPGGGGAGTANRPGGGGAGARPSTRPASGNKVGNRTASSRPRY